MLVLNPKARISIPEILSHPWMINKDEMLLQDDMIDITNKRELYSLSHSTLSYNTMAETTSEPDINQVVIDNLF